MSSESQFLEAIANAPHDTVARLVYADWLDERGDPRGAVIQSHEALTALSPIDAQFWNAKEELQNRRWAIDHEWLARLGYDCVYRPSFTNRHGDLAACWRAIERFIELWHMPLSRDDGYSDEELDAVERRLGVGLPVAMRQWYRLAGRRLSLWDIAWPEAQFEPSWQETMIPLSELRYDLALDGFSFCRRDESMRLTYCIRGKDVTCADPPVWVYGWPLNLVRSKSLLCVSVRLSEFLAQSLFLATRGRAQSVTCVRTIHPQEVRSWLHPAQLPSWRGPLTPLAISEGEDLYAIWTQSSQRMYVVTRSNRQFEQMSQDSLAHLRGATGLAQLGVAVEATPLLQDNDDFFYSYE